VCAAHTPRAALSNVFFKKYHVFLSFTGYFDFFFLKKGIDISLQNKRGPQKRENRRNSLKLHSVCVMMRRTLISFVLSTGG
jgi:hypothetical protein